MTGKFDRIVEQIGDRLADADRFTVEMAERKVNGDRRGCPAELHVPLAHELVDHVQEVELSSRQVLLFQSRRLEQGVNHVREAEGRFSDDIDVMFDLWVTGFRKVLFQQ